MKSDRNAFKAGLFIILSFTAALAVIIVLRGDGAGAVQVRTVTFKLTDDLGGLGVGDEVRIGGIKVGTVRAVNIAGLDSANPRVRVRIAIPQSYVVREGARVGVQSALTGPGNLNFTTLGAGKPLTAGAALAGIPDPKNELLASLGRVTPHVETIAQNVETQTLPKVNETVAAFKQTADSTNTLVRHVDSKIDPVVGKYNGVADNTGQAMAQIRDLFGDTKTDFRGTVKNLNEATATVRDKLPGLIDKVTGVVDKVDGIVVSARAALIDVQKTAANAREVSAGARSVMIDNRGKLDGMIKGLKTTSDNLKATSIEVRRSPWRLLYKPSADEMGNLNLYDSTRQFAEGAASVSDAATALRDSLKDPNVDKTQVQKLVGQLDESFKNFHLAEDKLWNSVKQ
ncbi:MAG TPA: MlaD family protein [Tepidisphaeraceae bacterium]|nr:MlaD family protein [Tepidisphaeraceae bacterium]